MPQRSQEFRSTCLRPSYVMDSACRRSAALLVRLFKTPRQCDARTKTAATIEDGRRNMQGGRSPDRGARPDGDDHHRCDLRDRDEDQRAPRIAPRARAVNHQPVTTNDEPLPPSYLLAVARRRRASEATAAISSEG